MPAKRNDDWMPAFLAFLSETPIVGLALKHAKVTRKVVRNRRDKDAEFSAAYDDAMEDGLDNLEMDLIKLGRGDTRGNVAAVIYHLKVKRYEKNAGGDLPSKLTLEWNREGSDG